MKKYLLQLLGVAALFFGIIVFIFGTTYFILKNSSFKTDEKKNILILGDSHTECAINDQIFERAINTSSSGTHYVFCNIILEKMINDNPQIDTVLLSFHAKSLTRTFSERMEYFFENKIAHYIYYTKAEQIEGLPWKTDSYLEILRNPFKKIKDIRKGLARKPLTFGGFLELHRDKLYEEVELVSNIYMQEREMKIDSTTSQYAQLRKIEQLCSEKNIKLILINCPTYQVEKYTNRSLFDSMRVAILPEIDYLDFSDFVLPDSCYGDITHLNYRGSRAFSEYLQQYGLNNKPGNKNTQIGYK